MCVCELINYTEITLIIDKDKEKSSFTGLHRHFYVKVYSSYR